MRGRLPEIEFYAMTTLLFSLVVPPPNASFGQESRIPEGFRRVTGKYLDIVTDLPIDDELRALPLVFEKAMPVWCASFGIAPNDVAQWHAEAFIMLDRGRFQSAGFIPEHLPDFPYGFQFGDRLWVAEQPSAYYRRHLLLHEGTHWFMNRTFGANGPPWLMEGMAEWLGTHRWNPVTGNLEMGVIPASKTEVPYWGRITRIRDELKGGTAPSLEDIMRYDGTAHRQVEAYAWSWAAVLFLTQHADTRGPFQEIFQQPMRKDMSQTQWLFQRLRTKWPAIRAQWNAFVSDIDYGLDVSSGLLQVTTEPRPLDANGISLRVDVARSWQPSAVFVREGQVIRIEASGEYVIGNDPKPWRCYPEGVTLDYFQGLPLGRLVMTIATPLPSEQRTQEIAVYSVGSKARVTAKTSGELHFRVNEPTQALRDNAGSVWVQCALGDEAVGARTH